MTAEIAKVGVKTVGIQVLIYFFISELYMKMGGSQYQQNNPRGSDDIII